MAIATISEVTNLYNLTNVDEVKEFLFQDILRAMNITLQPFQKLVGIQKALDSNEVQTIVNHPVHIIDISKNLSASALIPFCKFGDEWIGVKNDHFDVPVCDIFEAKILNDQHCYEVDPNKLRESVSEKDFKQGITFYIDTNEDRQTASTHSDFMIYMDTLGAYKQNILNLDPFRHT